MSNSIFTEQRSKYRKTSLYAGIFYLLTFISIPTLSLYAATKDPAFFTGVGSASPVVIGAVLEILMALACIGSAVVLYPVLKKQSKELSLGLLSARILEAAVIFVGTAVMILLIAMRHMELNANILTGMGEVFRGFYDKLFLVSQSLLPAVDDLLLGVLLYKSRLIPRAISMIGIIGAPLLLAGFLAVVFGLVEQGGTVAALSAVCVALFEFILGLWLVIRGFNPNAIQNINNKTTFQG